MDCKVSTITCAESFRVSKKKHRAGGDEARRRRAIYSLYLLFFVRTITTSLPPPVPIHVKLSRRIPRGIGVRFHREVAHPQGWQRQFGNSEVEGRREVLGREADRPTRWWHRETYGSYDVDDLANWRSWLTITLASPDVALDFPAAELKDEEKTMTRGLGNRRCIVLAE